MDQSVLVESGRRLIRAMSQAGMAPRAALWVNASDTDSWKLWIVPPSEISDKREFYRHVSEIISRNPGSLAGLDASDTEFVSDKHPAITALGKLFRAEDDSLIQLSGTTFNGYYLPDSIILQMRM